MDTHSVGRSHEGRRKNNEDFLAYFEPTDPAELKTYGSLYIVADGVGGAAKGERASQYAAQKVLFDYYQPFASSDQRGLPEPLTYLRGILKKVNNEIHDYAEKNDTRMATTIVVAVIREGFLYVANVGDSRAYLIRDGSAAQVNRDHSLVGEMVEQDEMTEAEAMASSIKNRLTRSLGGDPDVSVDTYPPIRLQNGDKILLCTDGLTRYALKEKVAEMTSTGTIEEIAERLVKFANDSGGADNVSVIVIAYKPEFDTESQTLPVIRPRDVDLDTLTPTYHALPHRRVRRTFMDDLDNAFSQNKKWLPFAVLLTLVFVMFIGFAAARILFPQFFKVEPAQPLPTLIGTSTETATPTPPPPSPTPVTPSPTPITPTADIGAPENSDSQNPLPGGWCVYQLKSGEGFLNVPGLGYDKNDTTRRFHRCEVNEQEKKCTEEIGFASDVTLGVGWWIIVDGINDVQSCEVKGTDRQWFTKP